MKTAKLRWVLYEYKGRELVILSKSFKTKALAEKARLKQRLGHIARGVVLGRMRKTLETVFGSVCGVAIPNDDPAGPRLCRTKHAQGRTRRYMASWLLQF